MEEKNAIIGSATLTTGDHGCLSSYLNLNYGDGLFQGFGGYALQLDPSSRHFSKKGIAGWWIWRVLEIAGVDDWSKLKGRPIRVRLDKGIVYSIGHIVDNDWFCPKKDFEETKPEGGGEQ